MFTQGQLEMVSLLLSLSISDYWLLIASETHDSAHQLPFTVLQVDIKTLENCCFKENMALFFQESRTFQNDPGYFHSSALEKKKPRHAKVTVCEQILLSLYLPVNGNWRIYLINSLLIYYKVWKCVTLGKSVKKTEESASVRPHVKHQLGFAAAVLSYEK